VCGKGTYVRTLAADLGDALGVGAAVARLTRLRVGPFTLDDAVSWTELDGPVEALLERIAPPEAALASWPAVHLDTMRAGAFRHGQPVDADAAAGLVRVHGDDGALIGVGVVDADEGRRLRPVRILHADRSDARVLPA
jgi:tRNA pseudouridine55 synthase